MVSFINCLIHEYNKTESTKLNTPDAVYAEMEEGIKIYRCPKCGAKTTQLTYTRYCPNCGPIADNECIKEEEE